ncbi:MAG: exopolysaccharide biosynthesis protein [Parvibaculum sp.]
MKKKKKGRSGAIRGLAGVGTRRVPDGNSVGAVLDGLGDRSFGWALLFVGLLNMLPLPYGSNMVFGLPSLFISVQMMLGKNTLWLPRFILKRHIERETWRKAALKALPIARPLARLTKVRLTYLFRGRAERVLGIVLVASAINLCLPIPLSAWLPAISFAIVGIGLVEHDGAIVALGGGLAIGSIMISIAMVIAFYFGVSFFAG